MHLLFLHLQTICYLQSLLFSYLHSCQKLVCKYVFCINFHYSSIPDTSNSQITQSETPQTPSPNPILLTSVVHASFSQEISMNAEIIQQHIYNFIAPYPFEWGFLMAGNWKKRKRCQFWQDTCREDIICNKNSGKKAYVNVELHF